MNARMALLALPLLGFPFISLAQPSAEVPPPEVDRALRARATEFFQYYVDGNFRKAYDLVAEDTKDSYFNAGKNRINSFEFTGIKYSDNFTKAEIMVKATRDIFVLGQRVPTEIVEPMTFKIEDGKWVWYYVSTGAIITPMGAAYADPNSAPVDPSKLSLPADLSPEGIRALGLKVLGQTRIDKSEISMPLDKASETKVVFHNGMAGPVRVQIAQFGEVAGFSAKFEKTQLSGGEDTAMVVRYDPRGQEPPDAPVELRLVVSPTNQAFSVIVKFTPAVH